MFKLEAIRALHGDALLLHYGTPASPRYALIDGGPATVWRNTLQPQLTRLRRDDTAVPLRWIAVTHVDDDHIVGVIDLLKDLRDAQAQAHTSSATATTPWLFFNTPGPAAKQLASVAVARRCALDRARAAIDTELTRVATIQPPALRETYRQGAEIANFAMDLQIGRNPADGVRLLVGDELPADVVAPLRVRVVSPTPAIMDRLIREWEDQLGPGGGVTARTIENRLANLSSIVLLVEDGDKRMLLTGDALDFDIIAGLEELGLVEPDGTFRVDVLKLPHHGATGNNHAALFERVKATHYVISADGNFGNPDPSVLELLVKSEKARSITIWLTNGPGENGRYAKVLDDRFARLTALIAKHDAKRVKVRYPSSRDRSVIVTISR